jgi:hypothetical protein
LIEPWWLMLSGSRGAAADERFGVPQPAIELI